MIIFRKLLSYRSSKYENMSLWEELVNKILCKYKEY